MITEARIRHWLKQFERYNGIANNDDKKRLALTLLQNVEHHNDRDFDKMYDKFWKPLPASEKANVVVTPFGTSGSSSIIITHRFLAQCKLGEKPLKDIPEMQASSLKLALMSKDIQSKTILFIDDVIGTGTQSVRYLRGLLGSKAKAPLKEISRREQLSKKGVQLFLSTQSILLVFLALESGEDELNDFLKKKEIPLKIIPYTRRPLQKIFDPQNSSLFGSPTLLSQAREMAREIGYYILEDEARKRKWTDEERRAAALGFGDYQQLLVFDHGPPKFTLPVLWKKGNYKGLWIPLFPRP